MSSFLVLLVACGDSQISKVTEPPTVAIESPPDASVIDEGVPIAMRGRVVDAAWSDSLDQEVVVWSVNGAQICADASADTSGLTLCEHTFSAGDAKVTLTVTNPDGQTATAEANLTVNVNHAPTADISAPTTDGSYNSYAPTLFNAKVNDDEDEEDSLVVSWTSDVDGALAISSMPTSDGTTSGTALLSAGSHTITLTVTDTTGRTGQDNVQINVAVGEEPELELTAPTSGQEVEEGASVNFAATVSDDRTNESDLVFEWESNIDGVFSTQGASSSGSVEFAYAGLSAGTHTITVRATDEDGMTAVDSTTLIVTVVEGVEPDLELTAPRTGDEAGYGDLLTFAATVSDDRTAEEAISFEWESSLDGVFSTEGATSSGEAEFYYDGLSVGTHTITVRATDADGMTAEDSATLVVSLGDAPELILVSPTSGQEALVGTYVSFEATVSDDRTAETAIDFTWSSNLDGVFSTEGASSSGTASFSYAGLSAGTHTITVEATDEDGLSTSDSAILVIGLGDAPDVDLTSPTTGDETLYGDPFTFSATVSDDRTAAGDLTLQWESSIDGVFSTDGASSSGDAAFVYSGLSVGTHTITLRVTDGDGFTSTDRAVLTVGLGDAPVLELTSPLSGQESLVGDLLSFSATVSDDRTAENDLDFEWSSSLDGLFSTEGASSAGEADFVYDGLSAGTHTITVTVTDGDGLTAVDSATILVTLGGAPNISLETPGTGEAYNEGEDIFFSALVSDDRTDARDVDLSWESSQDGLFSVESADSSGAAEFLYDGLSPGTHTITLTAIDTDGYTSVDSATITVNGIPTAPVVVISPDPADSTDALNVTIVTAATDVDGDPLTYAYRWSLNDVVTSYTSNPLPASATTRGDVWTVEVSATDGMATSVAGSDSVTVENAAPTLSSVTISPATAYTNDTLSAVPAGFSDPDGDSAAYLYQWYKDGVAISGATDATLAGTRFSRDEAISVDVWPYDGADTGPAVRSGTRVITNTPPTSPVVAVTPELPAPGVDLTCGITTPSVDDDADPVSYAYSWTRNGSATGLTTATISGSYTSADEIWACTVIASDGTDTASPVSDSVTVDDYIAPDAPVLSAVDPYRNETSAVVYGTAEPLSTITLYEVTDSGTSTATSTANGAGSFTFSRTLAPGESYSWYATATDAEGNVSSVSNTVGTQTCDPVDDFEDGSGYGDTCGAAVADWAVLPDTAATTLSFTGNILDGTDEDWYTVTTSDGATSGINYYRFHVQMTAGSSDYAFVVYQGGCSASYLVCDSGSESDPEGDGYTEFDDFVEDNGEAHTAPSDTRACYDSTSGYNNCEDMSDTYYIHVIRTSSTYDCTPYSLQITNGSW